MDQEYFIIPSSNVNPTQNVVLGSGDYYIPISYDTYRYGVIIVVAVFLVIILLLLGYAFYRERKYSTSVPSISTTARGSRVSRPPLILNLNTMHGASNDNYRFRHAMDGTDFPTASTCNANPTSTWSGNSCVCDYPYWGKSCNRPIHDDTFIEVGNTNSDIEVRCIMMGTTANLFECTDECNKSDECNGVMWDNGNCKTIDKILVGEGTNFTFDPQVSSEIYMRNLDALIYTDRVFIFQGQVTPRYYIIDQSRVEGSRHITAMKGMQYTINFYPTSVINNGNLTGKYWISEDEYVIIKPGQELDLPVSWYDEMINVMYE